MSIQTNLLRCRECRRYVADLNDDGDCEECESDVTELDEID